MGLHECVGDVNIRKVKIIWAMHTVENRTSKVISTAYLITVDLSLRFGTKDFDMYLKYNLLNR